MLIIAHANLKFIFAVRPVWPLFFGLGDYSCPKLTGYVGKVFAFFFDIILVIARVTLKPIFALVTCVVLVFWFWCLLTCDLFWLCRLRLCFFFFLTYPNDTPCDLYIYHCPCHLCCPTFWVFVGTHV